MKKSVSDSKPKRVRADAQRNIETLLQTALAVFSSSGVDAPVREIAEKAGVGVGTIYRHFPRRSDLVVAVFRNEVDLCADCGPEFAASFQPEEALMKWVDCYVDFITAKRGLATALNSEDPAFSDLPGYLLQRLRPVVQKLLDAAAEDGKIRKDVEPDDLLYAIAGLCTSPGCTEPHDARRMIALFVDGLRYGATGASC
ncbi:TetR/AcrR family transcriptional regulator [Vibrio mangrovi]|uniref:HTH-type transcriptional repressor KstR2 n=1 Tax=Vibrio mangrovi TaxID=474394 RepID=A0A1Y6IN86_9VIBR|nr:TetR/AcrR family transcriptional regulator [Vibrio mangrovi]MDW6004096.1 TetR/AcrR family transcriptional regulator [Vibrio mangrovi]SMR99106.1 HTH-type transcriptional repressor KstR2 [Vibrio mangrovi]